MELIHFAETLFRPSAGAGIIVSQAHFNKLPFAVLLSPVERLFGQFLDSTGSSASASAQSIPMPTWIRIKL